MSEEMRGDSFFLPPGKPLPSPHDDPGPQMAFRLGGLQIRKSRPNPSSWMKMSLTMSASHLLQSALEQRDHHKDASVLSTRGLVRYLSITRRMMTRARSERQAFAHALLELEMAVATATEGQLNEH